MKCRYRTFTSRTIPLPTRSVFKQTTVAGNYAKLRLFQAYGNKLLRLLLLYHYGQYNCVTAISLRPNQFTSGQFGILIDRNRRWTVVVLRGQRCDRTVCIQYRFSITASNPRLYFFITLISAAFLSADHVSRDYLFLQRNREFVYIEALFYIVN